LPSILPPSRHGRVEACPMFQMSTSVQPKLDSEVSLTETLAVISHRASYHSTLESKLESTNISMSKFDVLEFHANISMGVTKPAPERIK
jgi:hypothetical protein